VLVSNPETLRKIRNAHILAVGGDGTFHTAINHADLESNSFTCIALGSGNDFITGFPKRGLEVLALRIMQNLVQKVDLIHCNGIYVHNIAGIGFEALVAKKAHEKSYGIPALKYIIPVIRNLFTFKPIHIKFHSDSLQFAGKVFMLSMGNGKRAGGSFRLFPKANIRDGLMDVLLIKPPTLFQKLRYVWLVNFGKHLNLKIIEYYQIKQCKITIENLQIFEADGDLYDAQELQVTVLPDLLKVIQ
jgi:YegS/Rv2252/BmrU family lipid kinase